MIQLIIEKCLIAFQAKGIDGGGASVGKGFLDMERKTKGREDRVCKMC